MALIRSLTSGTSSLKAHQQRLDVISNNIANANTVGYKASRTTFADQFSQTYGLGSAPNNIASGGIGGIDPLQIGLGVKLGSVKVDFSQGSIQSTTRPLDLALQGEGFFSFKLNGRDMFSRAGAFSLDKKGNLVDSASGAYVQGYNLETDSAGRVTKDSNSANTLLRKVANVQISPTFKSAPRQTQNVSVSGNLNAISGVGDAFSTSISIYDNQGAPHALNLKFTKSAANTFALEGTIDSVSTPLSGVPTSVTFNPDGTLSTPLNFTVAASDLNTALGSVAFDATTPRDVKVTLANPNELLAGLTQYSGQNTVTAREQDGYTAGDIASISVDQTGKIIGAFSNGQSELLGQVVITKFINAGGLVKEGGNFFSVSPNSGLPAVGTAVEIFPSTRVASGSLEESNVDLTEQFTDMITTQRAFEAAAKSIATSDEFLNTINQLKR